MKKILSIVLTIMLIISVCPLGLFSITANAATGNTTEFAGGTGTEDDPYLISTKYHLDNVRNYLSSNFKMINDIEFTETDFSEDGDFYNYGVCFKPIGDLKNAFTGNFNGNNFKIKNLQIHKKNSDYVGLFGYISEGNICNLHLENATVEGNNYVSGVCGYNYYSDITNIHLINANVKGNDYVGGICGYLDSYMRAFASAAGVVQIDYCYTSGSIIGCDNVGGICGYMAGSSYIYYSSYNVTRIDKFKNISIKNCLNEMFVSGTSNIGGISGYAISGGCTIDSCSNNGTIISENKAGGIIGYSEQDLQYYLYKVRTGNTTGAYYDKYEYYYYYPKISNCVNKGDITANQSGGIIGSSDYISTQASRYTKLEIHNGVSNSYNIGKLTGDTVGGILPGEFRGQIENCFYLDTSASEYSNSYGTSISANDMKLIDTFNTWDFDTVWTMAGDKDYKYPELQCFTLRGDLSFEGDVAYKGTVIPDISAVENAYSELTYDWYVDGELVHTGESYTFAESDIGKTVKLKATSSHPMSLGGVWSKGKVVTKATQTQTPTIPTLTGKTDYSFEITTTDTQEYSIDNENWQTGGKFENLDPNKEYTVYSRILENDLYLLGESTQVLKVTTDRRAISGNVKILGTAQYGQTITADVSEILPTDATFGYEWKVSGNTVGTESSYTITENDIGKAIILVINGSGNYTGTLSSKPVSATKATSQKPNVPEISKVTNTTVTLVEKSGCEYSLDKLNWQDSPMFNGLNAAESYTFYQRTKETNTVFASDCSDGVSVTTLKNTVNAPEKPTAKTVTNVSITLTLIDGYEYSMDGVTWQTSNVFGDLIPNTEYAFYQRKAETEVDYSSEKSEILLVKTLKNSVLAPDAPTVEKATDNSVTLTEIGGYEYSKDGITWQKSNVFSDLTVLTTYNFYQRIAETNTDYASPCSKATSFKVKYVSSKANAPTLKTVTNNTIEVEKTDGYVYSIDGKTWSANNVFENLKPHTVYYVYARIIETDTHYAGEVSDALSVTTLKNTVNAPSAPTVSTKTCDSVTLVSDSNYEYSKDGITWQVSNIFTNLSPNTEYTFYQRFAETDICYASDKSDGLKVTTLKMTLSAPSAPEVSSKTHTSVVLVAKSGYEYSKDGTTWQSSNVFDNLDVYTQYRFYQRIAETDTTYASEASSALTVTTLKKTAPAPKDITVLRTTATSVTLAKYTGYEYSKDGTVYQASNVFSGLNANTTYKFYQRIAETDDTYASESSVCSVKTSAKSACSISPTAPIVASTSNYSITLINKDGYEYSKNGTTWQKSNVFTGLSANTSYTFYQRIAETDSELASAKSSGVTAKTLKTVSATTAATNYDRLRSHISSYGTTNDDGNKELVFKESSSNNYVFYFSLENTSSGIKFTYLANSSQSSKIMVWTYFTLSKTSKTSPAYTQTAYYVSGKAVDSVSTTTTFNRSTYYSTKTFSLNKKGTYITASDFSGNYSDSLKLLSTYWDNYIYSKLGFGLKGLGFISFSGSGSLVCDPLASYHIGTRETKNAYNATCTTDGYTGDKYCSCCGEKISSGSVIKCSGSHTYSNSCDKDCNVCGEQRVVEHTYSNECDTTCNICGHTRTEIQHVFDNDCDDTCNICSHKRKAPHNYDNREDLICNDCGYERPLYVVGDTNDDDTITDADAIYLLMHTFFPEDYPVNQECDFNGDGKVNDADAEYLLMYTFFPEEYPLH